MKTHPLGPDQLRKSVVESDGDRSARPDKREADRPLEAHVPSLITRNKLGS